MIVPPWEWTVTFLPGDICRTIMCGTKEVAYCNPRGDWTDAEEADFSAGIAHAAKMHMLLRQIASEGPTLSDATVANIKRLMANVENMDTGRYVEPEEEDD